jgi:Na+-translocating ferredoxin:NAD+ oxidoreductase subunit A
MKGLRQYQWLVGLFIVALLLVGCKTDHQFVKKTEFKDADKVVITFAGPVDEAWATDVRNFSAYEEPDPDIRLTIKEAALSPDGTTLTLTFEAPLNTGEAHIINTTNIVSEGQDLGAAELTVKKLYFGVLLSVLLGAALINNFVFTKYLGLCVFFGTSQKRGTAIGMGIVFTLVMVFAATMAWALYQFVLKPYQLTFLNIVVFIGLVSLSVQGVDTVLRKVNPVLFKAFGVFLVLVIANCIAIAVPLMLADNEYTGWESFSLALGAGLGFLIALFLMACAREKLELGQVPPSFRGLPIAFVTAGLFALAFLGFSGLTIY